MPSPIGHTLMGSIVYFIANKKVTFKRGQFLAGFLFCLIYSNLPDLDFLPGIFIGSLNKFHHTATHSFVFAVITALLTGVIARYIFKKSFRRYAGLSFILLFMHIIMDYLTADTSIPYGAMIFWPFSRSYFISPVTIFPAYKKRAVIMDIINPANMAGYIQELLLLLPFLVLFVFLRRGRRCTKPQ